MSLADLMPSIQSLSHDEKLQLIRLLTADVVQSTESVQADHVPTVAIWSPFDAQEGAATLLQVLKEAKGAE